ncbi:unnamed protein product, partial [marine sediment metagenome]
TTIFIISSGQQFFIIFVIKVMKMAFALAVAAAEFFD